MILDCDRLWTGMVTFVYRLRRLPRVTNDPPPVSTRRTEPSPVGLTPPNSSST